MGKITKRTIPVMKNGRMDNVNATFFPGRRAVDYMPLFKEFLKSYKGKQNLHSCPHHLYLDAAAWWQATDTPFHCGCQKRMKKIKLWQEFLKGKGVV